MRKIRLTLGSMVLMPLVIATSGCEIKMRFPFMYRPNLQQGNALDEARVAQLRKGQTESQVRYLLGTPILQDPLHTKRWDYIYTFESGETGRQTQKRLTVFFDEDMKLAHVSGDYQPKLNAPPTLIPLPSATSPLTGGGQSEESPVLMPAEPSFPEDPDLL
jgi:outer membrane protein assembly factor BamE